LLAASLFLLNCSGSNATREGDNKSNVSAQAVKPDDTAKPEHLTTATFKLKVMDYVKNPTQWVYEGDKPCVIDFYADWCRPCKRVAPIMEELAKEYKGQIKIYKVDTDAEKELASVFGISSIPTVIFVPMQGNPSAQTGALPKEAYKQIIDDFLLKKNQSTGEVIKTNN